MSWIIDAFVYLNIFGIRILDYLAGFFFSLHSRRYYFADDNSLLNDSRDNQNRYNTLFISLHANDNDIFQVYVKCTMYRAR